MTLTAQGITIRTGDCPIVDNAALSVTPGEIVGLIGPNGAGKSTLLRALAGVARPDEGEILLEGKALTSYTPRQRARRLAYLPQERRIEWALPAREVVMLGRYPHYRGLKGPGPACHEAVDRALETVGATGFATRPATVLSGGEKALILLARALAAEAPLLLADEPIAALDPHHQLTVMEVLRGEARAGRAVICVLHDLTLAARFMDRLVMMNRGRVAAQGAPQEVLTAERLAEVYRISAIDGHHDGRPWIIPWETSRPYGSGDPGGSEE